MAYVLVTSPAPAAIDEVRYFAARLKEQGMRPDAIVINRLQLAPEKADSAAVLAAARELGVDLSPDTLDAIQRAAEDDRVRARFESSQLAVLQAAFAGGSTELVRVPVLSSDVHDVRGLSSVAATLFAV